MTYDIISIGESLRDVFYQLDEANGSSHLDTERNLLCFEYAEKIPVKHVVKVPAAGNASNAAVGASRLGLKSALVSWVGDDHAGRHSREALQKDRVDCRYLLTDKLHPTSEATILNYKTERTQFVYFQPRSYNLPRLATARCIYYTAMGNHHATFDRAVLKHLTAHPKTFFVFQPGTTHVLGGLKHIRGLIMRSDLFILNKDEAHHLLPDGDRTTLAMMERFLSIGAKTVVVTDGANGAECYNGTSHCRIPVFPAQPVEKTGAGDSFAIGMTAAILLGKNVHEALRWGTANGWSVIQRIGPQKGLLTVNEMRKVLKKFSRIKAQMLQHPRHPMSS
ncbi:carbohydrate kinase family protein [Candidatus Uhrbacteria bacterium]|nr:carbohydrate kinase family protein [Candidatus Uhrbacteria bacterium]